MNIIAENIARRRKELGLTQKELAEKLNVSDTSVKEKIDYARITSYKIVLLTGAFLLVLGSGVYSFMGVLWNYMKIGALILFIIGLAVFCIGELTYAEFYRRKDEIDIYQKIHKRWFQIVVLLLGLVIGIVIPLLKSPIVTLFNNWDAITERNTIFIHI